MPPAIWPSAVRRSDWCICASISRCVVMSRTIASMPSVPPLRPGRNESVMARFSGRPSARLAGASKARTGFSRERVPRADRYGSCGRRFAKGCSTAWAAVKPKMRSAAGFQLRTCPSPSTEMIASPAETISCSRYCLVSATSP